MRTTSTSRAWPTVVLTVSVLVLVASDLVTWLTHQAGYPTVYEYWLEGTLGSLAYGFVGWFITRRVPGNALGPLMLAGVAASAIQSAAGNAAVVGFHQGWSHTTVALCAGMFKASQTAFVGMVLLVLLLAPDGRPLNRFYSWVCRAVVAAMSLAVLADLLRGSDTSSLAGGPPHDGGLVTGGVSAVLGTVEGVTFTIPAVASLLAIVGLLLRWRGTEGEARRQVTWVVGGGVAGLLFIWLLALVSVLLSTSSDIGSVAWALAGVSLPLGIAVAVLKHGLYELDRVVSRTISYAVVSGGVVGLYVVTVTLLTSLVPSTSSLPVAAATLVAAAAIQPMLRRVRTAVDRRFNRAHYDALRTVDDFGERLRHVVHPEEVSRGLMTAVSAALEPSSARLWLRATP